MKYATKNKLVSTIIFITICGNGKCLSNQTKMALRIIWQIIIIINGSSSSRLAFLDLNTHFLFQINIIIVDTVLDINVAMAMIISLLLLLLMILNSVKSRAVVIKDTIDALINCFLFFISSPHIYYSK